ncbi:hypothetical protein IWQ60_010237 [Tieghemiomyces parasiticus]|uniref:Uncharacterized protein n=1 Tax=Tieghemiomyces parasiticus TaxID=78921 RepID=A0A9W7ZQW6_9FUNG|nr:hypothetical protein IWQ60_010237 [Tieghemiomyces parasiticus]
MQSVGSLGNMSTPSLNLAFAGSPHSVNPPASPFTPYTPRMHSSSPLSSRSVVSLDMKGISRDLAGPTSGLPSALLGGTLGDGKSSSGGGGLGTSGGSGSGPAAGSGVGGSSGSNSGTGPSDDPWTILRANLLPLFNGDEPPRRIEELGQLVRACMQTCKNAHALIHDIRELLTMGCLTLLAKLQSAPDERLIQRLGEVWHAFARMTLPRLEGVFLPLHTVEVSTVTARPSRVRANSSSSVKSGTATGTGGGGGNSSISATIVPTTAAAVGPHPQYQNFSVRQDILLCLRNLVVVPIYHRIEAALARAMATDGDALLKVNQYIPRIFQMLAMLSFLHTDDENQFLVDRVWAQVRHMFLHLPETQ